ncbi:ABC transporter substrate-binding protein [Herbiconiux sp. KACC 21604]|uniref:ABC transporter substrate-binding protein n=1 Tax=unclassified Herbiconiux TaxID=2618217 RepID=UPI001492EB3A|nr:ABC transporter substrate-binding protein [Herbiconiux sp. SALV-R1]QJU53006.1 ABC transporter substrate-binding protein [Herbiconiux sp. SALV-R1]WPO87938.1 ABC transporter substrate-binding protein [Herbiconiux sp. KACC 21604]
MVTAIKKGRLVAGLVAVSAVVALAGCASSDPLGTTSTSGAGSSDGASGPIVIGSQAYYSNEIIAEIYAQALEANDIEVTRQFNIGQRDAYLPALESGEVQLFPEYTGNLLQYYDPETTAKTSDDVYAALASALPSGLEVLDQSPATDQDSYNVTKEFSEQNGVTSLEDLSKVTTPITLGGNSELQTRPYGPEGLLSTYGVTVGFTPIEDSGGPLTIQALKDNTVQMVNIYSADPNIKTSGLVTLEDPKGLFLASNVVPLINTDAATPEVTEVINKVSAALTAEDLVDLNSQSVNDQDSAENIAKNWLEKVALF